MSGRHALVVRLDSMGDVVVCGPAVRAVAAGSDRTTMLVGPTGAAAAGLLPGVDHVIEWDCPWISGDPPAVRDGQLRAVIERLSGLGIDAAVVLTSFHQTALPTALVLRLAGIPWIAAVSEDYPGSLLDVRIAPPGDAPEPERMLAIARAAGYLLPADDDGCLRVVVGDCPDDLPEEPYLVVHPGATAPARTYPASGWREVIASLTGRGRTVIVTGGAHEKALVSLVASASTSPGRVVEAAGTYSLGELAAVLQHSDVLLVANTGPAHLAAAVGTPVVSLFAPVVPARRWAPYGVARVLLGDQDSPCRDSRARECAVPGHPCLSSVRAGDVVAAAEQLIAVGAS